VRFRATPTPRAKASIATSFRLLPGSRAAKQNSVPPVN
jgi:hypothetical protein